MHIALYGGIMDLVNTLLEIILGLLGGLGG